MNFIISIIKLILGFFFKKETVNVEEQTISILESRKEEIKTQKELEKIKNQTGPVGLSKDGGISFQKFNNTIYVFFVLIIVGCSVNMGTKEQEKEYITERYPVYKIPERPSLSDLPGEDIQKLTKETQEKIINNYNLLIQYAEAIKQIVINYNKYAIEKNNKNKLYNKLD